MMNFSEYDYERDRMIINQHADDLVPSRSDSLGPIAAKKMVELCMAVGRTMIKEIVCDCGCANKTRDEWFSGLMKDACSKCGRELPINEIFGTLQTELLAFLHVDPKKHVKLELEPSDFDDPFER
jgi:hypothetical protein